MTAIKQAVRLWIHKARCSIIGLVAGDMSVGLNLVIVGEVQLSGRTDGYFNNVHFVGEITGLTYRMEDLPPFAEAEGDE